MSVGYTFKAPNMNYTKEFFDKIYSRVLNFRVDTKQCITNIDGQTYTTIFNSLNNYWFYYGLPDCLYPYIKDKTLPQVCDYSFLKNYVEELKYSNRAFKNFKHNIHPELRCFISGVRFFQLYNSIEPKCRVFQRKIYNAIQLILQTKTYNFGLGLKLAKRQLDKDLKDLIT